MHLLHDILVPLILFAGVIASIRWKKLTAPAALTGGIAGWLVFAAGGFTGLLMLAAFFILGTLATSWKKKEKGHAAQEMRTTGQVLANGGVAALAGLCILLFPAYLHTLEMVMAGSLASATADTLSSELGMVYGRRYYNILTYKRDLRGLDGVVSMEGLLIGAAGSAVIAILYAVSHTWHPTILIIVVAGTAGNVTDSLLGATLERKGVMGNNMVNFLNTLTAGLLAAWLA
jgi:uncharacterized protein (TIGR00297 family)